jgi:hypothetical protein
MADRIVSTKLKVSGVHSDAEVKRALQALYDVFTPLGLGQATFEVTDGHLTQLWVKHLDSVTVDVDALNAALESAGEFRIVSAE